MVQLLHDGVPAAEDQYTLTNQWREVVQEYTSFRQLSDDDDRLPALAGPAQAFSRRWQCDYYAGLWASDLLWQLTWRCSWSDDRRRPQRYRAPSWSWASIEGHALYFAISSPVKTLSYIERVQVVHQHKEDPFGKVQGGTLVIRGWEISLTHEQLRNATQNEWNLHYEDEQRGKVDVVALVQDGEEATNDLVAQWTLYGLLLSPLLPGLWHRVGLALFNREASPFDGMGPNNLEMITII